MEAQSATKTAKRLSLSVFMLKNHVSAIGSELRGNSMAFRSGRRVSVSRGGGGIVTQISVASSLNHRSVYRTYFVIETPLRMSSLLTRQQSSFITFIQPATLIFELAALHLDCARTLLACSVVCKDWNHYACTTNSETLWKAVRQLLKIIELFANGKLAGRRKSVQTLSVLSPRIV